MGNLLSQFNNGLFVSLVALALATFQVGCNKKQFFTTTTTQDSLELVGIGLEPDPVQHKTWNLACNEAECEFRFVLDEFPDTLPTGPYSKETFVEFSKNYPDGTYYLHAQTKDQVGRESEVVHSRVIIDRTGPVVEVRKASEIVPFHQGTYVDFIINEPIRPIAEETIQIENAMLSGVTAIDRQVKFRISNFTGNAKMFVPKNSILDLAGNPMQGDGKLVEIKYDGDVPEVQLSIDSTSLTSPDLRATSASEVKIDVKIEKSDYKKFNAEKLVLVGASLVAPIPAFPGQEFNFKVKPTPVTVGGSDPHQRVQVYFNEGAFVDEATNLSAASAPAVFTHDNVKPKILLGETVLNYTEKRIYVDVTAGEMLYTTASNCSEAVSGVTGVKCVQISRSASGQGYTLVFERVNTASDSGTIAFTLNVNQFYDRAKNIAEMAPGQSASYSKSFDFDKTAPAFNFGNITSNSLLGNGKVFDVRKPGTIEINVELSKPATIDQSKLEVLGFTASGLAAVPVTLIGNKPGVKITFSNPTHLATRTPFSLKFKEGFLTSVGTTPLKSAEATASGFVAAVGVKFNVQANQKFSGIESSSFELRGSYNPQLNWAINSCEVLKSGATHTLSPVESSKTIAECKWFWNLPSVLLNGTDYAFKAKDSDGLETTSNVFQIEIAAVNPSIGVKLVDTTSGTGVLEKALEPSAIVYDGSTTPSLQDFGGAANGATRTIRVELSNLNGLVVSSYNFIGSTSTSTSTSTSAITKTGCSAGSTTCGIYFSQSGVIEVTTTVTFTNEKKAKFKFSSKSLATPVIEWSSHKLGVDYAILPPTNQDGGYKYSHDICLRNITNNSFDVPIKEADVKLFTDSNGNSAYPTTGEDSHFAINTENSSCFESGTKLIGNSVAYSSQKTCQEQGGCTVRLEFHSKNADPEKHQGQPASAYLIAKPQVAGSFISTNTQARGKFNSKVVRKFNYYAKPSCEAQIFDMSAIPSDSKLKIKAIGAGGGSVTTSSTILGGLGGKGAVLEKFFTRSDFSGNILEIFVGSAGKNNTGGACSGGTSANGAGGGGGYSGVKTESSWVLVSGGGGGGGRTYTATGNCYLKPSTQVQNQNYYINEGYIQPGEGGNAGFSGKNSKNIYAFDPGSNYQCESLNPAANGGTLSSHAVSTCTGGGGGGGYFPLLQDIGTTNCGEYAVPCRVGWPSGCKATSSNSSGGGAGGGSFVLGEDQPAISVPADTDEYGASGKDGLVSIEWEDHCWLAAEQPTNGDYSRMMCVEVKDSVSTPNVVHLPQEITQLKFKAWGAGGGGTLNHRGGAGGFLAGDLNVGSIESRPSNTLSILLGGGGKAGDSYGVAVNATNRGGENGGGLFTYKTGTTETFRYGGGGGGRTGIQYGSTEVATVGGGGGAGADGHYSKSGSATKFSIFGGTGGDAGIGSKTGFGSGGATQSYAYRGTVGFGAFTPVQGRSGADSLGAGTSSYFKETFLTLTGAGGYTDLRTDYLTIIYSPEFQNGIASQWAAYQSGVSDLHIPAKNIQYCSSSGNYTVSSGSNFKGGAGTISINSIEFASHPGGGGAGKIGGGVGCPFANNLSSSPGGGGGSSFFDSDYIVKDSVVEISAENGVPGGVNDRDYPGSAGEAGKAGQFAGQVGSNGGRKGGNGYVKLWWFVPKAGQ